MNDTTWAIHQPWCQPATSSTSRSDSPMAMASG